MRLRTAHSIIVAALVAAPALAQPPAPPAPPKPPAPPSLPGGRYQGGGPEQTERSSQKIKLGRQGAVTISNINGDIVVNATSGDEVTIDAVKRAKRIDRSNLERVAIRVDQRPGRVDIRTDYSESMRDTHGNLAVDFTIGVPADAAVEMHSVSGDLTVTGVQGLVRAESVSGNVTAIKTPHVDRAKSVSGNVELSDVTADGDLAAGSVSGSVHAKSLKTRSLDLNTVSGNVTLANVTCERVGIRSVSGNVDYEGPLARSGRYDFNTHSGNVRLVLTAGTGFELNASSFSGSIRSDLPMTIGGTGARGERGDHNEMGHRGMGQSMRATFGDGSAMLTVRTFSGDVVLAKK